MAGPCLRLLAAALCLGASVLPGTSALAQQGTDGTSWRAWGGEAGSTRYAPLSQIDASNVGDLEVLWRWSSGTLQGERPESNYRVTPLMVGGVLYATAGWDRSVLALDALSGETLWTYTFDEGERARSAPRRNSGRGVAYWEDGDDARVIVITPAFFMVALDAETGLPVSEFGAGGVVDLREGLSRPIDTLRDPLGSSSPAVVVGDVLVVGSALPGGAAPAVTLMPPGDVRGYDARTGEKLWTFNTIPRNREPGSETWADDSWKSNGNAAVWTTFSADLERGLVYLPTEAATHDYYGGHRPGDNLFTQSLVCLDAQTGKLVWHFQTVHHGIWDYDNPAAPVLADLMVDGRAVPAVALVTKQGFTFVFDRTTGEPVWPIEERQVPQSDVPGESTAPTQPFPTKPAPFERQGVTEDDLLDLTPELKSEALEIARHFQLGPLFTPPSLAVRGGPYGTLTLPGSLGGANWPGASLDPETGILYVTSATDPAMLGLRVPDPGQSELDYVRAGRPPELELSRAGGPQGLPLIKPPWGRITAINLNTGEHEWMRPNGEAPEYVREHPALAGVEIGYWGRPDRGGSLVTSTLLFIGEGGGMYAGYGSGGPLLRAHDKRSGEVVAAIELPGNQTGVPMTYEWQGRQIIVLAVGTRGEHGELVALALPR